MALCHITGTVQLPDGTVAAGRIIVFKRNPATAVAQSGYGIAPEDIRVRVAQDGTVDFYLYTGNYIGFLKKHRRDSDVWFKFPVPDQASALFQDILQEADPVEPLPAWLVEVLEARDEAVQAAEDASDEADRAEAAAASVIANYPVFLSSYGVGTGGDDAPKIAAALAAANGAPVVASYGMNIEISTAIDYTGSVDLDLSGASVTVSANVRPFRFSAPVSGLLPLTANYDPVSSPLLLQVSGLADAPAVGQVFWIASNARDPSNRDDGSGAQQYRCGEAFRAGVGSTATNIVLEAPLKLVEGIQPESSAGDEPRVPSYTTAMLTKAVMLDMAATCRVIMPDSIRFIENGSTTNWNAGTLALRGYVNPYVSGGNMHRGYGAYITFQGTYGAVAENIACHNLTDNPSNNQLGYVVADSGYGTRVSGVKSSNIRHVYTSNKDNVDFATLTNPYALIAIGRTYGAVVEGVQSTGGTASIISTHADAESSVFSNCVLENTQGPGFGMRGRELLMTSSVIKNARRGIYLFTEYDSGDPDEDFFNNGKLVNDFSSGTFVSPMVDCSGLAIYNAAATMRVTGSGNYRTRSWQAVRNSGGILEMSGDQYFHISGNGNDADSTAMIECSANTSASAAAFPTPTIYFRSGTHIFDARAYTGTTKTAMLAPAGTSIVVGNGAVVRLLLPAGFNLFGASATTIVCERGGRIEYSIEGQTSIVTGLGARPIYLVCLPSGEVMDGTQAGENLGYNRIVDYTTNRLNLNVVASGGNGVWIRNTTADLSAGASAGNITVETNDANNPAMEAARIAWPAANTLGFVDTKFQRRNATSGALVDALIVTAGGNVNLMAADGVTIGAQWNATTSELVANSGRVRLLSNTGPLLTAGAGDPEGVVTAPIGSMYLRTDGTAGATQYIKEAGAGNTGWVAK